MFKLDQFLPEEEGVTLTLNDELFHNALSYEPASMERFHVKNDKGEDFDIVYWDNSDDLEPFATYPKYVKPPYMAKYDVYDETDQESLYIKFFEGKKDMAFEELNEYTIVLTKVVLSFTDLQVWCKDERILWFVPEHPRLHISELAPEQRFTGTTFYIQEAFRCGLEDNNFDRLSSTYAFHNVFVLQWALGGRKLSDYKFMTVPIDATGGIGALLTGYKRNQSIFAEFGKKFAAPDKDRFGKYPRDFVEKYFAVDIWDPEANESNTLMIPNLVLFVKTKIYQDREDSVDASIISDAFKKEMDEYYEAVFGGKKTLGILIRGTDYIATGLSGVRKMATPEQMIPKIHQWIDAYGFEKIFLATEDKNILRKMHAEFGSMLSALSQERIGVSDLKSGQILSDYEKEHGGDDYLGKLTDTTVNYFYALYLLSRCDSFMCSGQCNGWDTVRALNQGRFHECYKFAVGVNGDPLTEDWKELGPVTAGMFSRGTYPSEKAFFMTFRFDLAEPVDPEVLRRAWEQTLIAYPYMGRAILTRQQRLIFTENPLPFVIEETGETIAPFDRAGNFHMVTFGYLGHTLWIYVDHVATDGAGCRALFETLFYHYYCLLDNEEYPVPEGVFTAGDGAVSGHDTDGYLSVDAVDPSKLGDFAGEAAFTVPECPGGGFLSDTSVCRAYCLSVPGEELLSRAKEIGASPFSLISVAMAKALQRVHPENTLPLKMMIPVSGRKTVGTENSILPQGIMAQYGFAPEDLAKKDDKELNAALRAYMKGFLQDDSVRMLMGVFRGINEGYAKAYSANVLDSITMPQREKAGAGVMSSYIGKLRTGVYGSRIRMTVFRAMRENGIMLQSCEVGGTFYLNWSQGLTDAKYVRAMRDVLAGMGIKGLCIERME